MGQPTWRSVRTLIVPEQAGWQWTVGLESVTPNTLLKIEVAMNTTWTPDGFIVPCSADGDSSRAIHRDDVMIPTASLGALIARIGGSTADQTIESNRHMMLFAVGRFCVLQVPETAKGSLFLGVNDRAVCMHRVAGHLSVTISEAL